MGWNEATKAAKESSGGLYLQLKDKEEATITIIGEPVHFYSIYQDKTEYQTHVPGSNFKFKTQIVEIVDDKMQGRLWSQGAKAFKRLTYINSKMGGVKDKILLVAREGSGKDDTVYNIDVVGTLSTEQKEQIKKIKLPEMERKDGISTSGMPPTYDVPPPDSEDIPF